MHALSRIPIFLNVTQLVDLCFACHILSY